MPKNEINILGKIPFDTELGTLNSNGLIVIREKEKYRELFSNLLSAVTKEVGNETVINT